MDYKTETLKVYEKFPDYFDEKFGEYVSKYIKERIEEICLRFPKGAKVLDLGSGTGNHALILKNKGFDVLCFDISEKMLKKCEEKGLKTIKGDLENLNFSKNSFDVVWAYTSLLHVPKSKILGIINNISSILKKDGYFCLSLKEGIGEGFVDFKQGGKRWFSLYKHEEILKLLKGKFEIAKSWKVQVNENKIFLDYLCRKIP